MTAQTDQIAPSTSFNPLRNQDVWLATGVLAILVILIIPIPAWSLDIFLTLNISLSMVVLLGTIYLKKPVEFAVFPSLLLILTLFRLSLNVASTKLILGHAAAGNVINAFGSFVTGNNYIVGVVVFAIIVVIQFVVITKGATRISEVAARFTLDAMPGKQMGVDADLNAGLISEDQARARRREIEQEADFYGAMDGATKFVRGDAVAGIIITIVNILVGLAVGVWQREMSLADAAQTYTQLTIGDGLVTQVPAVIISVAAGIIVTRTTSDTNLGADLSNQLRRYPRALGISGVMLAIFGLVPGMPTVPFLAIAAVLGGLAYQSSQQFQREATAELALAEAEESAAEVEPEERTEDLLIVDPLKVELGYGLIQLADANQGGDLLTRVQIIRQQMASKMGFIVPVVRIVDNMRLRPNEYVVKLREAEIARYELVPDHVLAMNPGLAQEEVPGIPTTEPAFGLQAVWVGPAERDRADLLGYTIVEPSAVVATHLTELLMTHAAELLTRQDVQKLVDTVKETAPSVVEELLPTVLNLGEVQKVLQSLLRERVSIRNLEVVLETLADFGPRTRDVELLTEYSRHALARQVCAEFVDEENALHVVTLSPTLEADILEAVRQNDNGDFIPLKPDRADAIATQTVEAVQPLVAAGQDPIVLTSAQVRRYFKRIIERHLPKAVVLSYNEIDPSVNLESEGQVGA